MGLQLHEKTQYLKIIGTEKQYNGKRNITYHKCLCVCGNICYVTPNDYNRKANQSCGCLKSKLIKDRLSKIIPAGTKFGYLTVINRLDEKSTEGYKYKCSCTCGNIINVYYNRLKRGETKSCGCLSRKLNSLSNGGTGIPGETLVLQKRIRTSSEYKTWLLTCLKRAQYVSELSGLSGKYEVHHKNSLSYLIKHYNITTKNYTNHFNILYDIHNGIVLTKEEHKIFHSQFGQITTEEMWNMFVTDKNKYLPLVDRPLTKKRELVLNEFKDKTVGKLTLLNEVRDYRGRRAYLCLCSCGNIKEYPLSTLKRNSWSFVVTCGKCPKVKKDLTGNTYGHLTVLKLDSISNITHKAQYLCQCSCSLIKVIAAESLVRGLSNSCGKCGQIKRGPKSPLIV